MSRDLDNIKNKTEKAFRIRDFGEKGLLESSIQVGADQFICQARIDEGELREIAQQYCLDIQVNTIRNINNKKGE